MHSPRTLLRLAHRGSDPLSARNGDPPLVSGATARLGFFALKKALWIDIDRNADAAARLGRGGQHGAQESLQVGGPRRFGGEAEPMAFAQHRDRRLGRAEQDNLIVLWLPAERRDAPVLAAGR